MTSRTTAVRTMSEIFIFFFLSRFIALTLDSVDSTVESDIQFEKFSQNRSPHDNGENFCFSANFAIIPFLATEQFANQYRDGNSPESQTNPSEPHSNQPRGSQARQ